MNDSVCFGVCGERVCVCLVWVCQCECRWWCGLSREAKMGNSSQLTSSINLMICSGAPWRAILTWMHRANHLGKFLYWLDIIQKRIVLPFFLKLLLTWTSFTVRLILEITMQCRIESCNFKHSTLSLSPLYLFWIDYSNRFLSADRCRIISDHSVSNQHINWFQTRKIPLWPQGSWRMTLSVKGSFTLFFSCLCANGQTLSPPQQQSVILTAF